MNASVQKDTLVLTATNVIFHARHVLHLLIIVLNVIQVKIGILKWMLAKEIVYAMMGITMMALHYVSHVPIHV